VLAAGRLYPAEYPHARSSLSNDREAIGVAVKTTC
jgi:hypothetical protein